MAYNKASEERKWRYLRNQNYYRHKIYVNILENRKR